MTWSNDVLRTTQRALLPLANPTEAPAMRAYMKDIAPFLGIRASERRKALREAWVSLRSPTSDELGSAAFVLFAQREREFTYAATDLMTTFIERADERFLVDYVEDLLMTNSWWDSVDSLGSAAVSPLCLRYDASELVQKWSRHDNMWLNRAAIQHQRGWKRETDVAFVLALCDEHAHDRRFFIAKAIGWALRDISAFSPNDVERFLRRHPGLSTVAVREAQRGLSRLRA
jgi:3-methyladenine DNA glycosylase AlkD